MIVVLGYFAMSFFAMNLCVMMGLGLQWSGGAIIFFYLWFVSLPMVYYPSIVLNGGVSDIWKGLLFSYTILDIVFFLFFSCIDWYKISERVNREVGLKKNTETEQLMSSYGSINAA